MIELDLTAFQLAQNPFVITWLLIQSGGWILILITILLGIWDGWKTYIRNKYEFSIEHTILALDIPKLNEQSPKAVEHLFEHIYGTIRKGTIWDRYGKGYTQDANAISFEIIGIAGYIQFAIRTPVKFRDLVEASIYAQYPDAEITEIEDYVDMMPRPLELPHKDYDLWGTEYRFTKSDPYPIRTYPMFEHSLTQTFMDPMASFLEMISRLGPTEQVWFQIIVAPLAADWARKGVTLIKKLIGAKSSQSEDWTYIPRQVTQGITESLTASIIAPSEFEQTRKTDQKLPSLMQHMPPSERNIVEAIGYKIGRLAFKTKIRLVYFARRDVYDKVKAANALSGAMNQFNTQDLNSIIPHKKTMSTADYFFIKQRILTRQRRILWGYRSRALRRGRTTMILNVEELASLWHFPVETVKVPAVQRTETKKARPPIRLPTGQQIAPTSPVYAARTAPKPFNLPIK